MSPRAVSPPGEFDQLTGGSVAYALTLDGGVLCVRPCCIGAKTVSGSPSARRRRRLRGPSGLHVSKLPIMSGCDLVRTLRGAGFEFDQQKGPPRCLVWVTRAMGGSLKSSLTPFGRSAYACLRLSGGQGNPGTEPERRLRARPKGGRLVCRPSPPPLRAGLKAINPRGFGGLVPQGYPHKTARSRKRSK